MARGEKKSGREAKKPKQDKSKGVPQKSAYQQNVASAFGKKK